MVLGKLILSNIFVRKVRTSLTVGAIALSVSLVVAVTSGYRSFEAMALKYLNQYMGTADAIVLPSNDLQAQVPESLVAELSADPDVRRAEGRLESDREVSGPRGPSEVNLIGIRRPRDTEVEALTMVQGGWFNDSTSHSAVIDEAAADVFAVKIGQSFTLPGIQPLTLTVVGIVHKPEFFATHGCSVYAPMQTLQEFTNQDKPPQVSRINIDLRNNVDFSAFTKRWTTALAKIDTNLRLKMTRENSGELEKNLRIVHLLSYMGGTVSMLTAMFIIFSALSMGVTERQRTLAMLRVIGTTRLQVARLVVSEAIILALAGIAVGFPLGVLFLYMLYWKFQAVFAAGVVLSLGGILFAAGGSILTAMVASLLPAWSAARVDPLEAMNAFGSLSVSGRPPVRLAIIGFVLVALDPLLFFGPVQSLVELFHVQDAHEMTRLIRYVAHFAIGLPAEFTGFFLLAPLFVWLIELSLGPIVAFALGLPFKMLRQQLSSGIWRAAGTCAALMVGLATLIVMEVQGNTMLSGWRLPNKFPDIFIYGADPISWADQAKLANIPGIKPGELMPVVITTPTGDSPFQILMTAKSNNPDLAMMFFAVDPDQAFKMIELEFRDNQGHPYPPDQQKIVGVEVVKELKKGRRLIVTDEFREGRGLKIGDTINLLTSRHGRQAYTIAAIAWSPGADVIKSMFDMGALLDQQTAGSVFGTIEDAKNDFGVQGSRVFAANLEGDRSKEDLLAEAQKALGNIGLHAGDVRHVKYDIELGFHRLLLLVSTIAFAALAVASLGVTNTVMASVRSRQWQFGVLRSIGVTRGDLLRLVMAEAVLLGCVGVALGVACGTEMSIDAKQFSIAAIGYNPPFVVPWGILFIGGASVIAVSILASLWPAVTAARTEPLSLLQAGRAAM